MSKNENPKKVSKKTLVLEVLNHNAHNHQKNNYKNVTIIFCGKILGDFLLAYIKEKCYLINPKKSL